MLQLDIPTEKYPTDVTGINGNGKKLLEMCKNNMMFVFNGRVSDDTVIGKVLYCYWFIISCDYCEKL